VWLICVFVFTSFTNAVCVFVLVDLCVCQTVFTSSARRLDRVGSIGCFVASLLVLLIGVFVFAPSKKGNSKNCIY
jgi:hypothetical protein